MVGTVPPLEQRVADVIAVMDAVDSRTAFLYGAADSGQVGVLCAAMHPERVDGLILGNAWARLFRSEDYPYGFDPALAKEAASRCKERWGNLDDPWGTETCPSRVNDPGFLAMLARVQQVSASPSVAAAVALSDADVTDVLPSVQARTLVFYTAQSPSDLAAHSRFLADHIPNAVVRSESGADIYFGQSAPERTALIEEFITGAPAATVSDRVLATVLFTDIVSSTERLADIGDQRWRKELDQHDALVRDNLAKFRGREISTSGDGFFATFDGPMRAIQCAQAIIDAACHRGIEVRAGVHTGECEVRGDDLGGIAVHIGARVAALSTARQILTTSTVKDLVAGSGLKVADRGTYELKGVPDPWHLYEATQ